MEKTFHLIKHVVHHPAHGITHADLDLQLLFSRSIGCTAAHNSVISDGSGKVS